MYIKLCGIKRVEDANFIISEFSKIPTNDKHTLILGINFFEKSRRYVSLETALEIVNEIRELNNQVKIAGLFVNHTIEQVEKINQALKLDYLQFHGDETKEYLSAIKSIFHTKIIKAFRINEHNITQILELAKSLHNIISLSLFDYYQVDKFGGTGQLIPKKILTTLLDNGLLENALVAGGINPTNILDFKLNYPAIGYDVASGIEDPVTGFKSQTLVKELLERLFSQ